MVIHLINFRISRSLKLKTTPHCFTHFRNSLESLCTKTAHLRKRSCFLLWLCRLVCFLPSHILSSRCCYVSECLSGRRGRRLLLLSLARLPREQEGASWVVGSLWVARSSAWRGAAEGYRLRAALRRAPLRACFPRANAFVPLNSIVSVPIFAIITHTHIHTVCQHNGTAANHRVLVS